MLPEKISIKIKLEFSCKTAVITPFEKITSEYK
jgi:hypothetical protein